MFPKLDDLLTPKLQKLNKLSTNLFLVNLRLQLFKANPMIYKKDEK